MRKLKLMLVIVLAGTGFISFINGVKEPSIGLEYGNMVPEIKTDLITGSDFKLSSLQGKMVLIDFWASYDGASRVENHEKMILQKKYANSKFFKGEGFVIVSVSLDRFKSTFTKAITEDDYTNALHICDLKGIESPIAKTYKVNSPTKFLIDGEGRLVAHSTDLNKITSSLEYLIRN